MSESVTQVIVERAQRQEHLSRMVVASVLAHVVVLAMALAVPSGSTDRPVRNVMTISLGGSAGPRTEGLTQMGGRTVEAVAPPQPTPPPRRPEPPPPAAPPKMTLPPPKPAAAPPKPAADPPKAAPEPPRRAPARAATAPAPVTGDEITKGNTPVDTGARGAGFGLSSAGGGSGSGVTLDVQDFCCPEYIDQMIVVIDRAWRQDQGRQGISVIRFTIHRDGAIDAVAVARSSGSQPLDSAALRAVQQARLAPLPGAFPNPTLTVDLTFRY